MTRSPKKSSVSLLAAVTLSLLAASAANSQSGVAHADVPPPDVCNHEGDACSNAGDHFNQAGTCVASTCSHSYPSSEGMKTTTFGCNKCVASPMTTPSATSSGNASSATSVPPVQPTQKKDGCDVGASAPAPFEPVIGLFVALVAFPRKKRVVAITER